MFDVAVIGGGVIGGTILRELSKYNLNICLLEKNNDVAMGQSRANSGIVHAGFDAKPGSLKAKFNVLGSQMMEQYAKDLGVKYVNNGALVVAFSNEDIQTIWDLKNRGEQNGVQGLEIILQDKLREMEPNISPNAIAALYAKTSSIICPYELTISAIGNAMDNGASLFTNFEVQDINKQSDGFIIKSSNGQMLKTKLIINACGLGCEFIAKLLGDNSVEMGGRKGEYILLDRESWDFVNHTLFFTPTKKGKGILISRTVDNNILLGPTADDVLDGNTETTQEGLKSVINKAGEMCQRIPLYNTITSFAGTRAYCSRHDFIIEESSDCPGLINVAGIESPGLTSSPAIAKYVVEDIVSKHFELVKNDNFNAIRTSDFFFKSLSVDEKNALIKKDSRFGKIVCRCEQITEGEIVNVIHRNPKATDVDGVKRRIRAGMGRCQGGFCQPSVVEILSRELGISVEEVTKFGKGSDIIIGRTK